MHFLRIIAKLWIPFGSNTTKIIIFKVFTSVLSVKSFWFSYVLLFTFHSINNICNRAVDPVECRVRFIVFVALKEITNKVSYRLLNTGNIFSLYWYHFWLSYNLFSCHGLVSITGSCWNISLKDLFDPIRGCEDGYICIYIAIALGVKKIYIYI